MRLHECAEWKKRALQNMYICSAQVKWRVGACVARMDEAVGCSFVDDVGDG